MKTKTLYTCEKCFRDYYSEEKALQCEKSHLTPVSVKLPNKPKRINDEEGAPRNVDVTMENGLVVRYYLERILGMEEKDETSATDELFE